MTILVELNIILKLKLLMAKNKRRRKNTGHQVHAEGKQNKRSSKTFFSITGAVSGFVVALFASERNYIWMATGTLAGALLGFKLGQYIDKQVS